MAFSLNDFKKKKEYLVCVDSDGCAMDTMDIKHIRCFGPCMVKEWGLEKWESEILFRWNEINLYTMTRGINRFKALALALCEINEKYTAIEDIEALKAWVKGSDELSNNSLLRAIEENPQHISLKKALCWSRSVNDAINELSEEQKKPFELAKEALEFAHNKADIAIVSSANRDAVLKEWSKFNLIEHTDIVLAQDSGSKASCIGELIKKGYAPENVLMCGDAPGDMQAADKNGVLFYPILVHREKESWQEFISEGFGRLISNSFKGEYQQKKKTEFSKNLGEDK